MAHIEQREFFTTMAKRFPEYFRWCNVLEVGSLNINGTVRDFFSNCQYVGVDVGSGPGVDVVAYGENLTYNDDSFDVAVSAECFEHNPEWKATFINMARMTHGLVMFTCATTGRAEHGTTRTDPGSSPLTADWDYYQNLEADDFRVGCDLDEMFDEYQFSTNNASHDLYFWGITKGVKDDK